MIDGVWIGALSLGAIGASLVTTELRAITEALASRRWPHVIGHVESAFVDPGFSVGASKANPPARAVVRYAYSVSDTQFHGQRLDFGRRQHNLDPDTLATRYPAHSQVRVYFDPRDPERSVLTPGPTVAQWLAVGLGCGLVIAGALLPYLGR